MGLRKGKERRGLHAKLHREQLSFLRWWEVWEVWESLVTACTEYSNIDRVTVYLPLSTYLFVYRMFQSLWTCPKTRAGSLPYFTTYQRSADQKEHMPKRCLCNFQI